jgi:hypothetical protein
MKLSDIVTIAEDWIGTPFHQQGRQKKFGCDCIGLILAIAKEINAKPITGEPWEKCDVLTYDAIEDSKLLVEAMPKYFQKVITNPEPGHILLVEINKEQYHLAIKSHNNKIIHSCSSIGRVICHRIIPSWKVMEIFSYIF